MPTTAHPLRVRLYGGRIVHAVHYLAIPGGVETACGHFIDVLADNHWLDEDTDVTCRRCTRVLDQEASR
ncbi:hypothetical protein OHB04_02610 [Streptomyces sp. NBC_01775]|uniref:hypothetical protein n=1 Tax=Streptomyces sp. NBC_01775 TaxID=2975939 RepID=UPI002DDA9ABC|nr:hypothetical protein [Streptomyces sp. NBC_01775]WSB74785.1 hypothetical protein OHB04_02610 [Streptomyces sp. NBC_01775]